VSKGKTEVAASAKINLTRKEMFKSNMIKRSSTRTYTSVLSSKNRSS
jgi:hypothetical protein